MHGKKDNETETRRMDRKLKATGLPYQIHSEVQFKSRDNIPSRNAHRDLVKNCQQAQSTTPNCQQVFIRHENNHDSNNLSQNAALSRQIRIRNEGVNGWQSRIRN